jgi:hypothetical protein
MACYYAPNGKRSKLYDEAAKLYGDEVAEQIWMKTRTPEFQKEFGQWQLLANLDVDFTPNSLAHMKLMHDFSHVSPVRDSNHEPKLVFYNNTLQKDNLSTKLDMLLNNERVSHLKKVPNIVGNRFKGARPTNLNTEKAKEYNKIVKPSLKTIVKQINKNVSKLKKKEDQFVERFNRSPLPQDYKTTVALRRAVEAVNDGYQRIYNQLDRYSIDSSQAELLAELLVENFEEGLVFLEATIFKPAIEEFKADPELINFLEEQVNELSIPSDEKKSLIAELKTETPAAIDNVANTISNYQRDESYQPKVDSLRLESKGNENSRPMFITGNLKEVDSISKEEIKKAKREGYNGITDGNIYEMFNANSIIPADVDTRFSPVQERGLTRNQASGVISFLTNKLGGRTFKSDLSLKNEFFNDPTRMISSYNPNLVNYDTPILPFLILTSDVAAKHPLTPEIVSEYGNPSVIDNYKTVNSKETLNKDDYQQILVDHLKSPESIKEPYLLDHIDFLTANIARTLEVSPSIMNTDLTLLGLVDAMEVNEKIGLQNSNKSETPRFKGAGRKPTPLVDRIDVHRGQVTFDSSPGPEMNVFTQKPKLKHSYINNVLGHEFNYSITDVVREFDKMHRFDTEKYFKDNIKNYHLGKFGITDVNDVTAKDEINRFIQAVLLNDINEYTAFYPINEIVDASGNPMSNPILELFDQFVEKSLEWAVRADIGTDVHFLAEAVFTEESELSSDPKGAEKQAKLNELENLEEQIEKQAEVVLNKIGEVAKDWEERTNREKGRMYMDLHYEQRKLDRLKATKKLYDQLKDLKQKIKDRGGIFRTEVIVHSDKIRTKDFKEQRSVAGQIDLLVIYEDNEDVDEDYRGTVEIYDFKTMHYPPKTEAPYYEGRHGFKKSKQSEYAMQLLMYQRVLEEELNLKVKDSFIIPIELPHVDPYMMEIGGHYGIVETIQYDRKGFDLIPKSNEKGDGYARDILINIKNFKYYRKRRNDSIRLLPSSRADINIDEKADEELEKPEYISEDRAKERENAFTNIIDDIKIYIQKRIERISREISKDPEAAKKQRGVIQKLKNDMEDFNIIGKLTSFVETAHTEIIGTARKEGIVDRFESILLDYYAGNSNLSQVINEVDDLRLHAKNYDILDRIKKTLLNTDADERAKIEKSDLYKKLQEAIEEKQRFLEVRYFDEVDKLMARRLNRYTSKNTNAVASNFIKLRIAEFDRKIANLEEVIENTKEEGKKTALKIRLEQIKKDKINEIKDMQDSLLITEESILRDFQQLPKDISIIQRWGVAAISTSDPILSLYAKMVKWELSKTEKFLKDTAMDIQDLADKLDSSSFERGTFDYIGFRKTDNPEKYYKPILETVKEWVRDPETGEIQFVDTINLVGEYGTKDHITVDPVTGETKKVQMTYKNIIKDYGYRLRELRRQNKMKEYRKLQKEFEQWKDDNLEKEYTSEYYKMKKLLTKDDIGRKAAEKRQQLLNEIFDIKDGARADENDEFPEGRNEFHLTDDELLLIREKEIELKRLASIYNEDGSEKKGEALQIAKRLQEYNKMYSEIHTFDMNEEMFEKERSRAKIAYAENPEMYKLWLENNTETRIKDEQLDKVAFFRKLKTILDLGAYNPVYGEAFDFIVSMFDSGTSYSEMIDKVEEFEKELKAKGVDLSEISNNNISEKINDLIKPYRKGLKIDTASIPTDILAQIKELEQELSNQRFAERSVDEDEFLHNIDKWEAYGDVKKQILDSINNIIEYIPNSHYYEMYAFHQARAESVGSTIEETQWFLDNHVEMGEGNFRPTRAWTVTVPTDRITKPSQKYTLDRNKELDKLRSKQPGKTLEFYEAELRKTEWWKRNHNPDETGRDTDVELLREDSGYKVIDETQTDNVEVSPNYKYRMSTVKEKYRKSEAEQKKIRDEKGYLLPVKSKWTNKKYTELKANNKKWFDFLVAITEKYKEAQAKVPEAYRLGNRLPYISKSFKERLASGQAVKGAKEGFADFFGKALNRDIEGDQQAINMRDLSTSEVGLEPDAELDMSTQIEGKAVSQYTLDEREVPMKYVYHMDADEVSQDVISSIMMYIAEAERHNAVTEIMGETRALHALIEKRDSPNNEAGGVVARSGKDEKFIKAQAKRLGIKRFQRKEGESNAGALLRNFIEMQIFQELNKPVEWSFDLAGKKRSFRIDKTADSLMGMASFTQIGGINVTGFMKGVANGLQANFQILFESAAGEFYNKSDLLKAKRAVYTGNKKAGVRSVMQDFLSDFGKISGKTLTSQLFDIFDPLQGEFSDQYGRKVSQSKLSSLLSRDTWFFNQYIGEVEAAMTSMYAMLSGYKVDEDGNVYALDDYLEKKRQDKALAEGKESTDLDVQLTYQETNDFTKEFRKIKNSLLESFELDAKNRIKVKDGVKWDFDSDEHQALKTRLHGINKELQGNYNKFDQTAIQRHWYGRLAIMYRKYLIPMARRRFGSLRRNEEIGTIKEGYYRTFFKYLLTDFKRMGSIVYNAHFHKKDQGLSPMEEANMRRAFIEMATILLLSLTLMMLAPGDDEDKDEISSARYFALYQLLRLRKELGALAPTYTIIGDNWKLLNSPSALKGFIDRALKFGIQLSDPFAVYDRNYGIAEKGDSKLWIKFRKLFGTLSLPFVLENTNPRESYENLTRNW